MHAATRSFSFRLYQMTNAAKIANYFYRIGTRLNLARDFLSSVLLIIANSIVDFAASMSIISFEIMRDIHF